VRGIGSANHRLVAGVICLALMAPLGHVAAQSVDYGSMEQLFGEPVTTSATGRPQKVSEAPANMVIITQDDIRRSGAANIPDVLSFVAGLDVRRYGSVDADVAVRGYDQAFNPRLLVMVNGRQVYLDSYGYVAWQIIPIQLEEIRQIEVVMGPNSALFGFNAASGVINIITFDPLFDNVNAGTIRLGSQNTREASAVATVHAGENAGIRMSIGGLSQEEYKPVGLPPEITAFTRDPRLGSFNIDGKARVAPGVEVMLEVSAANAQNTDYSIGGLTAFDTYHSNSVRAGVVADTDLGLIAVNAWRNWFGTYTASAFIGSNTVPVDNTVYVFQASDTLQLNANHIIRVGLEYRDNFAASDQVFGGTIGYADYALSGMWDWRITPALSFTNSVRVDYLALRYSGALVPGNIYTNAQYNNATITQPSFNTGLVYKLTNLDTLRLTAARGLQAPSLIDFGLQYPAGSGPRPSASLGSPALQPTAVWNLELGYDRLVPAIASTLRGSVFVQRNDNLIAQGTSTLPGVLSTGILASVSQNIGYSDAAGGEIGIKGHSNSGFRWNASYSFMAIADHTSINKLYLTSPQNYQNGTPTSVVIAGVGYTKDKWELDASGRWQSRFTDYRLTVSGLEPVQISDYVTFQGRIGYNLTEHVTVALAGRQLNISRLSQSAGPPVERSLIGSITAHF
jgi:iron complex outermembrane receptor protein